MIKDDQKINLDILIGDFVQMVNSESADLSTDPNVKRVKVIKHTEECGCGINCKDVENELEA